MRKELVIITFVKVHLTTNILREEVDIQYSNKQNGMMNKAFQLKPMTHKQINEARL